MKIKFEILPREIRLKLHKQLVKAGFLTKTSKMFEVKAFYEKNYKFFNGEDFSFPNNNSDTYGLPRNDWSITVNNKGQTVNVFPTENGAIIWGVNQEVNNSFFIVFSKAINYLEEDLSVEFTRSTYNSVKEKVNELQKLLFTCRIEKLKDQENSKVFFFNKWFVKIKFDVQIVYLFFVKKGALYWGVDETQINQFFVVFSTSENYFSDDLEIKFSYKNQIEALEKIKEMQELETENIITLEKDVYGLFLNYWNLQINNFTEQEVNVFTTPKGAIYWGKEKNQDGHYFVVFSLEKFYFNDKSKLELRYTSLYDVVEKINEFKRIMNSSNGQFFH